MFSSVCTAKELLDGAEKDIGLFTPPSREALRDALNECLARLYTEIIRERRRIGATPSNRRVLLSALTPPEKCAEIREEDIFSAWCGDRQLRFLPSPTLPLGGNGHYTLEDGALILADAQDSTNLTLEFTVRPLRFTAENEDDRIPFPDEFLSLLRCRVRGEGCRLAGEDAAAAKWLGEYNTLLTEFRIWLATVQVERTR